MKVQIIIGSTRPGRQSDKLAKWVANHAADIAALNAEIVDLKDYDLPLFNEPSSPQYTPDRKPEGVTKQWLDKLAEADGYILITPEYNRSTSAVLKNAIDYIAYEWQKKPVAIVAHGSTGGAQAVAHLRGIIPGALGLSLPRVVYFNHRVGEVVNEAGELSEEIKANPWGPEAELKALLADLEWYLNATSVK
jgi:NAD(P)H-dependent FMN reductase